MAARAKALRASTCPLLGLDVEKLTPVDDVLVGRASALRLLVADLESAQLAGRAIDVAKYIDASAAVEDILRRPRSSVMRTARWYRAV